ncbi:hypothetical protein [Hymenobacter tenuis]
MVIKARSALDRQPLTILSELGGTEEAVKHNTPYAVVRPGQQYRFVLEQTAFFKISSLSEPEMYDFLNLIEFHVGNLVIVGHGELPYVALNMYGYRIYQ